MYMLESDGRSFDKEMGGCSLKKEWDAHFIPTSTPWEASIALETLAKSFLNPHIENPGYLDFFIVKNKSPWSLFPPVTGIRNYLNFFVNHS